MFCDMFQRSKLEILSEIDDLINLRYGSYNELMDLSCKEIRNIRTVLADKQMKEELAKSKANNG